jgi:UDP-glucose 4-epimerase
MSLNNKVILVTGGAGFIGSHLVDAILKESPEKVIVLDNLFLGKLKNLNNAYRDYENIDFKLIDITDYEMLGDVFKETPIDAVFNLAITPLPTSLVKPRWSWTQNIQMTLNICELARLDMFKTLIQFSSSEAYGTLLMNPMPESHPLYPHTPYAASKAATDHLVFSYYKTFGIDQSILRPYNNYGPRQNEKFYAGVIPLTIKRILSGEKPIIHGDGLQTRDFIYVTETARAAIDIYNNKKTRGLLLNIGTGKETTIKEYIEEIAKQMNYTGEIIYADPRLGDVRRHKGDITLARETIGFEPQISLQEGIRRTIVWYKDYFHSLSGKKTILQ